MNQEPRQGKERGIFIIHPGTVGDVLLARPSLSLIRRQFPQHEIVLLAGSAVGTLLQESTEIDRVFPLESTYLSELFAGDDSVHLAYKHWLRDCDLAVGWLQDTEGTITTTLRGLGVPRVCVRSPFSSGLLSEHQAGRYLEVLEGKPVGDVKSNPLILAARVRQCGRHLLQAINWSDRQRLVIVHPGSGSTHKCMEPGNFTPVIEWLRHEGTFPLLLQGGSDGEVVDRLQQTLPVAVPVIRNVELSTVAAVLSHADLYLGHDSGITHLAAALSVPTIACFGPTSPRRWAPLGRTVAIVTGATCNCPDWSCVERCREKVCLRISSERIIEVCRELLMKRTTVPAI